MSVRTWLTVAWAAIVTSLAIVSASASPAQTEWRRYDASFGHVEARIVAASTQLGYARLWLRAYTAEDETAERAVDVQVGSGWTNQSLVRWLTVVAPQRPAEATFLVPTWSLGGNDLQLKETRRGYLGVLALAPVQPTTSTTTGYGPHVRTVPLFHVAPSRPEASRSLALVEALSGGTLPHAEPFGGFAPFQLGDVNAWHARPEDELPTTSSRVSVSRGGMTITTHVVSRSSGSAPAGTPGATANRYSIQPIEFDDLPERAIELTSAAGVVVDASVFLPDPGELDVLLDYARTGGVLVLTGTSRARLIATSPPLAPHVEPRFELAAFGEEGARAAVYELGLGRLVVADAGLWASPPLLHALWWCFEREPNWLLDGQGWYAPYLHGAALPFPMLLPRRALAVLCIALALVIGPGSLLFAWRRKRPTMLLVSVPLLSLGATLVLAVVGLFRAGFGIDAAGASLALVDQRTGDIAVGEARGLLPGFTTVKGLRPAPDTIVLPTTADSGFGDTEPLVEEDGALLTGDYLPARERVRATITSTRRARQRLDVERDGGAVRVANGFDAALEALVLCDADGGLWRATGPLARGASAVLEPAEPAAIDDVLASIAPGPGFVATSRLVPGSYAARLDGPALVADLGVSLDWTERSGPHGVVGRLALEDLR